MFLQICLADALTAATDSLPITQMMSCAPAGPPPAAPHHVNSIARMAEELVVQRNQIFISIHEHTHTHTHAHAHAHTQELAHTLTQGMLELMYA
jgi:hypothetical protein